MTKSYTVVLVTNIPTPYRIPLFNELADQLDRNGLSLKVVFGALGYERRKWAIDMNDCRFEYEVLPNAVFRFKGSESVSFTYRGLNGLVRREKPAVTIITGFSLGTVKLWLRNLVVRTPYIIWSGAIESEARPTSALRRIQRRLLIRGAAGFVAYGGRAKRYFESLGAPADKISIAINTVDTAYYRRAVGDGNVRAHGRHEKAITFVGHLTAGKRLDLAFKAVRMLRAHRSDFVFSVVGAGPVESALRDLARTMEISATVKFEGFKQKNDIARMLGATDIFLFPSDYDIWGLVLVEAMAAGVPCIASVRAGATEDLIRDGVTGFAVDFNDTQAVADKIEWLLDHPEDAAGIGQAAQAFIQRSASLQVSAEGLTDAVLRIGASARSR